MRIISGSSKGKRILEPKDLNTRPLKDLTKESIFNILVHSNKFSVKLENSNVLDLFSGVGSFGLECLSRGSSNLTFVENYIHVLPILKKNISNLNYQDSSLIIEDDIVDNLNFNNFSKKYNTNINNHNVNNCIFTKIDRLKEISLEMNSNINNQNDKLNNLELGMDTNNNIISNNSKKIKKIL